MGDVARVRSFGALREVIDALGAHRSLDRACARAVMDALLSGNVATDDIAAILLAFRDKGVDGEELSGLLDGVRAASLTVTLPDDVAQRAIDIVGTGGDHSNSVNVSTMASFVVAGAGVPVCKHGNRAASSKCGTADVLEALGVRIEMSPAQVVACVQRSGVGFCFAPAFHPAFRHVGPVRRSLGVPTVFNLLGPLANPANVSFMLVGVADATMRPHMAAALSARGIRAAWLVHGAGGMDELSLAGANSIVTVARGEPAGETFFDATELGLAPAPTSELQGGDPAHNASIVRRIFAGEAGKLRAIRDTVILNAAAALRVAGVHDGWSAAIDAARRSIDSGAAAQRLDSFVDASNTLAP